METNTEIIKLITLHNSAWNWHILAVMFLLFSMLFFALRFTVFMAAFIFLFGLCEFMAWKRKTELNEVK